MTPKEKANELVDKMFDVDYFDDYEESTMIYKHAKQCALIAVNEMLDVLNQLTLEYEYWAEVKQEINLL